MEGIKGIAISRKMFESLEPMKLSKNIRNTEAAVYEFKHKGLIGPHILKKMHYSDGAVFGNKLNTLYLLNYYKEYMPPSFCIPDSIVTVAGKPEGLTLPKIEGPNLADILKDKTVSVADKLFYLKKAGQLLEQLDKIRKNTDLTDIYINDLHESNFIVNDKNHELYVIDLDSCKIKDNQPTPAKYLTPTSLVTTVQGKYKLADPECATYGYIEADENSDLFCYAMMVLNYLYGDSAYKLSLEEYYDYIEYLKKLNYSDEFINALQNMVTNHKNENIYPYLDELTSEQVYRSNEKVYKAYKSKK